MRLFGKSRETGRRSVPRAPSRLLAVLTTAQGDHPADLANISRTGARLNGEILPPTGAPVIFQADNVRTSGEVVWRDLHTCAVEFTTPIAASEVQGLRCLGSSACPTYQPQQLGLGALNGELPARARAELARRMAAALHDSRTRSDLLQIARDLDAQADEAEGLQSNS